MSNGPSSLLELERLSTQIETALATGNSDAARRLGAAMQALIADTFGPVPSEDLPPDYAALRAAIERGDVREVRQSAPRLDLNTPQGSFGTMPLHWAMMSEGRSVEMIELLLAAGALPNGATPDGYTALHFVSDFDGAGQDPADLDGIVLRLVAAGADLEARQHWGWTPLHRAIVEGLALEMRALLRHGANPNAPFAALAPGQDAGLTPLMVAGAELDKLALLLMHGADPSQPNAAGQCAVAYLAAEAERQAARVREKRAAGMLDPFDRDYAMGLFRAAALVAAHPQSQPEHESRPRTI